MMSHVFRATVVLVWTSAVLCIGLSSGFSADFKQYLDMPVSLDGKMGPIHVGMTIEQFQNATHHQFHIWNRDEEPQCYYALTARYPIEDEFNLQFMIVKDVVAAIEVGNRRIRTDHGIKIGDPAGRVRKAYGSSVQRIPWHYQKGDGTETGYSLIVSSSGGNIETIFGVQDEKVIGYSVGYADAVEAEDGCM
ncbi:MAG: hypothetical protein JO128_23650 [Alphaproteobacteria bacterium]|nr:hypothetical protein [Alphaproteobacteria bacterium]